MKKITVTVDKQGNSTVEAFGFTGGECLAATKSIEEALGKIGSRKMKSGGGDTVAVKATVKQ